MDLLEKTKQLCRLYDIKPARSLGQNFLIREGVYDQIIDRADLKANDTVLEVGPGLGFLTARLASRANRIVAVEIDRKLAGILRTGLMAQNIKNVEVINEDILKLRTLDHGLEKFKVVANLPYNITSIFLRRSLEAKVKPELMVLMLQKEVAQRIAVSPGQMSLLSVSVQFYAEAEIIKLVPKEFFWPKPEVDSAIIKITPRPRPRLDDMKIKEFFKLVKIGFSARRKMLKNNLAAGLRIDQAEAGAKIKSVGLNEKIRAQELSVDDWLKLLAAFE